MPAPPVRRWPAALAVALAATAVALLLQQVIRATWQVRTLPERVMEWLLLFVPLDLFEGGLERFGANAKELALLGTFIGMALVLVLVAVVALRRLASGWAMLVVGLGLWLVAMAGVMPLTGAGIFATGLLANPQVINAGYLVVFGGYAAVLALAAAARPAPARAVASVGPALPARRALLAGVVGVLGTVVAYGVGRFAAGSTVGVQSSLPLASAPSSQTAPPPSPAPTVRTAAGATPAPAAAAPTAVSAPRFPTPPPLRDLARDQEGSLTAAGRPPGTLAPLITANRDFYIVTKNAVADPVLDASSWRLVIDGQVARPVQVDYATLRALPSVELTKTLECISNLTAGCSMTSFGCDLISTARWRGARLSDVLGLAGGLKDGVVDVAFLGADEFSSGLPAEAVLDPDTLLVYEMNGETLPREHGYPARVLVPGRYGMKNPKWLAGIRALDQPYVDWYQQRGWTRDGIVKTMSRIDTPADGATLPPGSQPIAGIAYAGTRGIRLVEFSADGGTSWRPAELLEPPPGPDCWVRWRGSFDMPGSGSVTLVVRATDGTGAVQPEDFGLPAPDGSWGQDSIQVNAG